jgi:hypothetical protein
MFAILRREKHEKEISKNWKINARKSWIHTELLGYIVGMSI